MKIMLTLATKDIKKQEVEELAKTIGRLTKKECEFTWNDNPAHGHIVFEKAEGIAFTEVTDEKNIDEYLEKEPIKGFYKAQE